MIIEGIELSVAWHSYFHGVNRCFEPFAASLRMLASFSMLMAKENWVDKHQHSKSS